MRAWGAGVSAGYCVLGVAAYVADIPGSEMLFGLCAVLTLTLSLAVAPLLKPRGHDDGDGGVSPPPPDEPPPPWWPEFEREFRAYAERLTSVRGPT
jgi:hypothetical protein